MSSSKAQHVPDDGRRASAGAPAAASTRARPTPSGTTRTTQAFPPAGSTVSSKEPSSGDDVGAEGGATPCESTVRTKSTGFLAETSASAICSLTTRIMARESL